MYAVVKLRSGINASKKVRDTLKTLGLRKNNHCVLVSETPGYKGMLQKVKDYVAWGEISRESLKNLLRRRAHLIGGKRLTQDHIQKMGFESFDTLADAILNGGIELRDVPVKPVFKLHPPRKGHRGIKKSFAWGGELGYHGDEINSLLYKMR